jgi:hypothetical protein
MKKGYIKFLRTCNFRGCRYEEGAIISADEIGITKEEIKMLIEQKAIIPCMTRQGVNYSPGMKIR